MLDVSHTQIWKYGKTGRLVTNDAGMVDVRASMALIRAGADPGRGGRGGFDPKPRAPDPMELPPGAEAEAERLWEAAKFDDDTPGAPGSSRPYFPAPPAFHAVADELRAAVTLRLRHSIAVAGRVSIDAVYDEFCRRLEDETAGLARSIYQRALDIVRQQVAATTPAQSAEHQ
jgi:hypothetical protein